MKSSYVHQYQRDTTSKEVKTSSLELHYYFNPPKEIDDPDDKKPSDWDEREKIVDTNAKKPDDWDEDAPATIEDESAVKPSGWLDDEPEMIPDPSAVPPKDW
ncbi:unnamed protein product [Schistosoma margrebowiei]|uniref:Uncharacterized protein n=1 Tax=Schistosoma margrebowiei TaxID=48269 RepID=A0A183MV02_9TREM|nr:unnamed protein product [Schistosoma margrebowiei]